VVVVGGTVVVVTGLDARAEAGVAARVITALARTMTATAQIQAGEQRWRRIKIFCPPGSPGKRS